MLIKNILNNMASISLILEVKPKSKSRKSGLYPVVMRLYHYKYRAIRMDVWTLPNGWDKKNQRLRKGAYVNKHLRIDELNSEMETKVFKARQVIKEIGSSIHKLTPDRLVQLIHEEWDKNPSSELKQRANNQLSLLEWGNTIIKRKLAANEPGTAKWLKGGIQALLKFNGTEDIPLYDITIALLKNFEAHHLGLGHSKNTISIYLRAIRSIYNGSVAEGEFTPTKNAFKAYKIPKTVRTKKRALKKETFLQILDVAYEEDTPLWHTKNYALIMFYCRGMNFIDLVQLKVKNIVGGRLHYGRSKTGEPLSVEISEKLAEILGFYLSNKKPEQYLFPTNYDGSSKQFQKYKSQRRRMNERLRIIAKDAEIDSELTTYTIRHTWASIAKYMGISTALISEGLGHHSITTTEVYLKDFENRALDKMNELVTA